MTPKETFDILVVGGGHAGCEAALAAARLGARTLLVSLRLDKLAGMPCNPSIGGIAKSHLVFEIDALGGEMARNADFAGLQFRVLNTRRGPAVRANRAQCDKYVYSARMRAVLERTPGLTVLEDEVVSLLLRGDRVAGAALARSGEVSARRVILTAGTFLRGTIHIGHERTPGGGNGQPPSNPLADQLRGLMFHVNVSRPEPRLGSSPSPSTSTAAPARMANATPCRTFRGRPRTIPAGCSTWNTPPRPRTGRFPRP